MRSRLSVFCKRGDHLTCQHEGPECGCACHASVRTLARTQPLPPARKGPAPGWAKRPPRTATTRPRKEDAPCCVALRDPLGRLPIGYCSPDRLRRPNNWNAAR